ncbi:MAG: DUF4834 family protein [Bacteroidota bacterium]|uniref:DUF4834 family protein n=1 Tax=Pedobacter cryotolerans TaxID=2571270 RepID=A0A4U1CAE4_9SPHI|nr:DUF4834 family protein [Pedobacter cryotolerans]TKC03443.1 DUF4834 family protein [Pedobacter cryotolerans]
MILVKFIIITILVLWLIRVLIKLIFPMVLKKAFSNMQNQAGGNQQYQQTNPKSTKPEGSISIDYMPQKEKKGNADKLGDFVDYEEVK